jgi:hypothetical protein
MVVGDLRHVTGTMRRRARKTMGSGEPTNIGLGCRTYLVCVERIRTFALQALSSRSQTSHTSTLHTSDPAKTLTNRIFTFWMLHMLLYVYNADRCVSQFLPVAITLLIHGYPTASKAWPAERSARAKWTHEWRRVGVHCPIVHVGTF